MLVFWPRMSPDVVSLVHSDHRDPPNDRGGVVRLLPDDHLLLLRSLDLAGQISPSRIERSKNI